MELLKPDNSVVASGFEPIAKINVNMMGIVRIDNNLLFCLLLIPVNLRCKYF